MPDVLDHGYLMFIESWGSDERIIESARMSTGKGFKGWGDSGRCVRCGDDNPKHRGGRCQNVHGSNHNWEGGQEGDEKLLKFLWENKHATPFEMAGMTIEVKAPIFVFREWHRHRVPFGYNEMSARYTPLPNENYIPSVERLMLGSDGKNRQAGTVGGAEALTRETAEEFRRALKVSYASAETLYQDALLMGVPKELARVHLPVGRYSRMRATGNLRGWLGFLALRSTAKNPAAQYEIRQYADALHGVLTVKFPRTMSLFDEGK
jgi:thymidylate synthase (FAD)